MEGWTGYSYISTDTFFCGYIGLHLNSTAAAKSMERCVNFTKNIDPDIPYYSVVLPRRFPSDCPNGACISECGVGSYQACRWIPTSHLKDTEKLIETFTNLIYDPENDSRRFMG